MLYFYGFFYFLALYEDNDTGKSKDKGKNKDKDGWRSTKIPFRFSEVFRKAIIFKTLSNNKNEDKDIQNIQSAFEIKSRGNKDMDNEVWLYKIKDSKIISSKELKYIDRKDDYKEAEQIFDWKLDSDTIKSIPIYINKNRIPYNILPAEFQVIESKKVILIKCLAENYNDIMQTLK